jgi:imipenem/basic amino acid-specific outer membrane pore
MRFVTLLLLCTLPTWADTVTNDTNTTVNPASFDADIRTGYIYYKALHTNAANAKATGGSIGVTKQLSKAIEAKIKFYAIEALGANNSVSDFNLNSGATTSSFGFIGEASLKAIFDGHTFSIGRQKLDLPHDDSDDIRMLPNLFEAIKYNYKDRFHLTHINSMAGWENGGEQTEFIKVHSVFGITDTQGNTIDKGISVFHTMYNTEDENFNINFYNFIIHNAMNIAYVESNYNIEFSKEYKLSISAQVDNHSDIDTFQLSGVVQNSFNSTVYGLSSALELSKLNLNLTLAMNQAIGDHAPLGSLGGGPYYTSMEDSTIDAVGTSDASAYTMIVEYDASSFFYGLTLTYMYGAFQAKDLSLYKRNEQNFSLSYEEETFTLSAALTFVNGTSDFTLFRSFLDIPFESKN